MACLLHKVAIIREPEKRQFAIKFGNKRSIVKLFTMYSKSGNYCTYFWHAEYHFHQLAQLVALFQAFLASVSLPSPPEIQLHEMLGSLAHMATSI